MSFRKSAAALLCLLLFSAPAVAREEDRQSTCIGCHAGLEWDLAGPVAAWRGSIHAQNGIHCQNCHGGDPTLPTMESMSGDKGFRGIPKKAEIPDFCGRCHAGVKEDYLESAHGQALESGGPQCVTCHGSHEIRRTTLDLINPAACTACHEYGRADEIKNALIRTDATISNLESSLQRLHRIGIDTEALQRTVFSTRNEFHRLFHSVNVERIRRETSDFLDRLSEVEESISGIQEQLAVRARLGGIAVGLLFLATALFFYLRRLYHREEREGSHRQE